MPRILRAWPVLIALAIVFGACFHKAISGEQFSYRDAAHFYYPLYQRVQMEWDAGRWPLWEPEENAGMPLLGNPTAAVLYPGKLIYTALPYPLAARVYVMAHVLISVLGAYLLARQFGISLMGAAIAGISYAFAAPILFQYCNIIFLVGGAWTPFALRSADRWIRQKRPWAVAELAIVLALQVLGGDPQSAYMVGLCSGGYALGLAWLAHRKPGASHWGWSRRLTLAFVAFLVWTGLVIVAAMFLPALRPPSPRPPVPTFAWSPYVPTVVVGLWGLAGLAGFRAWSRKRPFARTITPMLIGLAGAATLAGALCAAQLLPVMEFTRLTGRAADEGAHDIYPFSLEPVRIVEFLFPNFFGTTYSGNNSWLTLVPPEVRHSIWVPSLYAGGITLIFALAAAGFRKGPAWRGWLTAIAVVSLLGSLGEFGGPLFWARRIPGLASLIGPHDLFDTNSIRLDRHLRDGDGSFYWMMSVTLPGFHTFRYPSKLLSFTMLAMAVLSGHGWDRIIAGDLRKKGKRLALGFGLVSLVGCVSVLAGSGLIRARFAKFTAASPFGPFSTSGALADLTGAVFQAMIMMASTYFLIWLTERRPKWVTVLVPLVLAADIALANANSVLTAPQADFDAPSKYLEILKAAEKANPSPGPYRIQRMPVWSPATWSMTGSEDRVRDFLIWERDTVQPKYGITRGVEYTYTQGTAELFDYEWFFGPFTQPVSARLAQSIGRIGTHERIIYYPRRGFDLWNTRYFILPGYTQWTDTERGVASLLQDCEQIYPVPGTFESADARPKYEAWIKNEDVQIVRNRNFMPRAWIVHNAWFRPPIKGLSRAQRAQPMEEMTFANDAIWHDPERVVHDPRRVAWIEDPEPRMIQEAIRNTNEHSDESVVITKMEPQRVEMDVKMIQNGLVILAETYYPGWKLTIDGEPAPILRANRLMRGALVKGSPKVQKLVYTYEPASFAWGLRASVIGGFLLLGTIAWAVRSGRSEHRTQQAD